MKTDEHYYINNDYKVVLVLHKYYTQEADDSYSAISNKVKATAANVAALQQFATENSTDYVNTEYDCNGSRRTHFTVKTRKGKVWLSEATSFDC